MIVVADTGSLRLEFRENSRGNNDATVQGFQDVCPVNENEMVERGAPARAEG